MIIALLLWVVVGGIAGTVMGKFFALGDEDPRLGAVAGIIGAIVVGIVYTMSSASPSGALTLLSLVPPTVGALGAAWAWFSWRRYVARA